MARSYTIEEPSDEPKSPRSSRHEYREVTTQMEDGIDDYEEALSARYAAEEAADMTASTWAAFEDY